MTEGPGTLPLDQKRPRVPAMSITEGSDAVRKHARTTISATSVRVSTGPAIVPGTRKEGSTSLRKEGGVTTPVNPDKLAACLTDYDRNKRTILIQGFRYGFHIRCGGEPPGQRTIPPNLKSALENPGVIGEKLDSELQLGRITGPYDSKP